VLITIGVASGPVGWFILGSTVVGAVVGGIWGWFEGKKQQGFGNGAQDVLSNDSGLIFVATASLPIEVGAFLRGAKFFRALQPAPNGPSPANRQPCPGQDGGKKELPFKLIEGELGKLDKIVKIEFNGEVFTLQCVGPAGGTTLSTIPNEHYINIGEQRYRVLDRSKK
jgi:hypothetical protein